MKTIIMLVKFNTSHLKLKNDTYEHLIIFRLKRLGVTAASIIHVEW